MKQKTIKPKTPTVSLPYALFAMNRLESQIKKRHPNLSIKHDPQSSTSEFFIAEDTGKEQPTIVVGTKHLKEQTKLGRLNARAFVMSVSHLFHEEQHCNQYEMLTYLKDNPEHVSPYAKKIATEMLISAHIPEYYQGTYWHNPAEQDAERYGCTAMKQFFTENFPEIQAEGLYLATIEQLPEYFTKQPVASITDAVVQMSQDIASDKHPAKNIRLICNPETGPSKGYKELVEHQTLGKLIQADSVEAKQNVLIDHLWDVHPEAFKDYPYLIPPEQPQKQMQRQTRAQQAEARFQNILHQTTEKNDYSYG